MNSPDIEFKKLRKICPKAELWQEGGQPLVFLPDLKVDYAGERVTIDALLHPGPHGGYETRLFFVRPLQSRGQNWTSHNLVSRAWHAMSWNGVAASLGWEEILAAHLRPLQ